MARNQKIVTIGGCLLMLLATLLPLVNVKSYRWNIFILPHKIDRLVQDATYNTIGKILVGALVLCPLIVVLVTWLKNHLPKPLALLPLIVAVAFIALLFMADRPAPGIGLWLYVVAAAVVGAISYKK